MTKAIVRTRSSSISLWCSPSKFTKKYSIWDTICSQSQIMLTERTRDTSYVCVCVCVCVWFPFVSNTFHFVFHKPHEVGTNEVGTNINVPPLSMRKLKLAGWNHLAKSCWSENLRLSGSTFKACTHLNWLCCLIFTISLKIVKYYLDSLRSKSICQLFFNLNTT